MTIKHIVNMRKSKGMKTVDCREGCGNKVEISSDSISGMCSSCVNKMMAGPLSGYMSEYGESDNIKDDDQEKQND